MSKFVVVDDILDQLEAAKSGVVPGSVCQAVVSGVQNVPANIIQKSTEAGGGCYTTFPLSPILKNCCIDKTYLNLEFDCNMIMTVTTGDSVAYTLPVFIGFRDTASIFNQVQILIENTALYTTVYHREESVIAYNSLPETEIRGNQQYASIEKLRNCSNCPMKRILVDIPAVDDGNANKNISIKIHYKLSVDINRLMPILSNLHYTTPHFGNLKLKVWLQKIQEAMFFCPDYNYLSYSSKDKDHIQAANNQYYSFYPLSTYMNQSIDKSHIPFYIYTPSVVNVAATVMFKPSDSEPFMTFNGGVAEIVQTCFEIKNEEYQRLTDYFSSIGSIIIPTQTFETGVYNNSSIDSGSQWIQTQTGTIGGYNVNFVSTWAHPSSQATAFQKEFLTNIQMLLDGRPINSLPYAFVNEKAIVDTTQAIIDTDHEEINKDYIDSLSCFNLTDTASYSDSSLAKVYGTGLTNSSIHRCFLSNPNTFCLNFSTNLPDAFHSGACILENSNRNGVLRFISSNAADTNTANLAADTFPYVMNHRNLAAANDTSTSIVGYTAFCDCCLVLTYDSARGTCYDGQLSWAAPYM